MGNVKIKVGVNTLSLFEGVYYLNKDLKNPIKWKHNPTINTLMDYIHSNRGLFLTYDGELDVVGYEDLIKSESVGLNDYEEFLFNSFKTMVDDDSGKV